MSELVDQAAPDSITVIMPVYNGARFLREALESVFAQVPAPLEVLLIDDGSKDESAEIAAQFPGVTWISQQNAGPGAARNRGMRLARGAFIAFIDQDDLEPSKLELQLKFLQSHPEALSCICLQQHRVEPGAIIPQWIPQRALAEDLPAYTPSALFARRSAFDTVGIFDETLRTGSDADWFFRARDAEQDPGVVTQPLIIKRLHNEAQSFDPRCTIEMLSVVRRSLSRKRQAAPPVAIRSAERPRISVIIPNYNNSKYIVEALQSVFAQTLLPTQIIVVDDGSTDDSRSIVQRFSSKVELICQRNSGPGAARNAGVKQSNGDYIAFLDSDDYWSVDALEVKWKALAANANIQMVFGYAANFLSQDCVGNKLVQQNFRTKELPGVIAGGMLARREVFSIAGYFGTHYKTGEFIDWIARADDLGVRRVVIEGVQLFRRVHENNTVTKVPNDYPRVLKEMLDRRRIGSRGPTAAAPEPSSKPAEPSTKKSANSRRDTH